MKESILNWDCSDGRKAWAIGWIRDLFNDFRPGSSQADMTEKIFSEGHEVSLIFDSSNFVGFGIIHNQEVYGQTVQYRVGTIVAKPYQGQRVYADMVKLAMIRHPADFL